MLSKPALRCFSIHGFSLSFLANHVADLDKFFVPEESLRNIIGITFLFLISCSD